MENLYTNRILNHKFFKRIDIGKEHYKYFKEFLIPKDYTLCDIDNKERLIECEDKYGDRFWLRMEYFISKAIMNDSLKFYYNEERNDFIECNFHSLQYRIFRKRIYVYAVFVNQLPF